MEPYYPLLAVRHHELFEKISIVFHVDIEIINSHGKFKYLSWIDNIFFVK